MDKTVRDVYVTIYKKPEYTKILQQIIKLTAVIKKRNKYTANIYIP